MLTISEMSFRKHSHLKYREDVNAEFTNFYNIFSLGIFVLVSEIPGTFKYKFCHFRDIFSPGIFSLKIILKNQILSGYNELLAIKDLAITDIAQNVD